MRELCIKTRTSSDVTVVALEGELDVASASRLVDEVRRALKSAERIIVDLSGLGFMDSTGLRALLSASELAASAGRRFAVVQGPRQVQRLMGLTRVAERLTILDDAGGDVSATSASDGAGRPFSP